MQKNIFEIYNASAGSGKTYSLVKKYLKTILQARYTNYFKHILAITFTNKAVAEMKSRILETLQEFFSSENDSYPELLIDLAKELNQSPEELQKKSAIIYNEILNNYATFDVVTIDTFTHRLIRTFAFDLQIPQNFEVALDTNEILQQAVNNLLDKIGQEEKLTDILLAYTLQKTDEDKSWDIGIDLFKSARILLNENDLQYLEELKEKSLNDFESLDKNLLEKIKKLNSKIINEAINILNLFNNESLSKEDFDRGSVFNHFVNLSNEKYPAKWDTKWQEKVIAGEPLYKKTTPDDKKTTIDRIHPIITTSFSETKSLIKELSFLKNAQRHLIPLSVINLVYQEIQLIKEDENILLISEFNKIIANEIKDQPTPFIYERLGERYKNYFIDEFQDTSVMQWKNVIPLVENALTSVSDENEQHSLMLVGDAKQSIYRWRGGKPEQFINLYQGHSPFFIKPNLINLETNYRSYSQVINFNNSFFSYLTQNFSNKDHQDLYKIGNQQLTNSKEGGYVQIEFIENLNKEESTLLYQEKVLNTIQNCLELGFDKKDICIITRKTTEGVELANYLAENNIDVLSSDSLLLKNSPRINFIISFLEVLANPDNKNSFLNILFFLYKHLNIQETAHNFYSSHINNSLDYFLVYLNQKHQINFLTDWARTLPLYELTETIVREFRLVKESDAYIQYFLDEIFSFTQKQTSGIIGFLDFWEDKKDNLSIVAPEGGDAISLMTIHKSKGLEFPIILFPFADLDIYKELEPKTWFPVNSEEFNGFNHLYISYNKELENFNELGKEVYLKRQSQLELDNINLLYVALTRAKEQLYIISKNTTSAKGEVKEGTYNSFFINYLKQNNLWNEDDEVYSFGNPSKLSLDSKPNTTGKLPFISSAKTNHNLSILTKQGYLWDTELEKAIERGNLIHLILSKIILANDVNFAIQDVISEGLLANDNVEEITNSIDQLLNHSELKTYFSSDYISYNERKILTKDGTILIPDRISLKEKKVTIIDYKTGNHQDKYENQINSYAKALKEMDLIIDKKFLVYLDSSIKIKEVN